MIFLKFAILCHLFANFAAVDIDPDEFLFIRNGINLEDCENGVCQGINYPLSERQIFTKSITCEELNRRQKSLEKSDNPWKAQLNEWTKEPSKKDKSDKSVESLMSEDGAGGPWWRIMDVVEKRKKAEGHFQRFYQKAKMGRTKLLAEDIKAAITRSGIGKYDIDCTDVIEILLTTTAKEKKEADIDQTFCEKMVKAKEVKGNFKTLLMALCQNKRITTVRRSDFEESAETRGIIFTLSKWINDPQGINLGFDQNAQLITALTTFSYPRLRFIFHLFEQKKFVGMDTNQTLAQKVTEIYWKQTGNRKQIAELVNGTADMHFWQTIKAIVDDVQHGRPYYYGNLLTEKLDKLHNGEKLASKDALNDIARIMLTRAPIDLADIVQEQTHYLTSELVKSRIETIIRFLDEAKEKKPKKGKSSYSQKKATLRAFLEIIGWAQKQDEEWTKERKLQKAREAEQLGAVQQKEEEMNQGKGGEQVGAVQKGHEHREEVEESAQKLKMLNMDGRRAVVGAVQPKPMSNIAAGPRKMNPGSTNVHRDDKLVMNMRNEGVGDVHKLNMNRIAASSVGGIHRGNTTGLNPEPRRPVDGIYRVNSGLKSERRRGGEVGAVQRRDMDLNPERERGEVRAVQRRDMDLNPERERGEVGAVQRRDMELNPERRRGEVRAVQRRDMDLNPERGRGEVGAVQRRDMDLNPEPGRGETFLLRGRMVADMGNRQRSPGPASKNMMDRGIGAVPGEVTDRNMRQQGSEEIGAESRGSMETNIGQRSQQQLRAVHRGYMGRKSFGRREEEEEEDGAVQRQNLVMKEEKASADVQKEREMNMNKERRGAQAEAVQLQQLNMDGQRAAETFENDKIERNMGIGNEVGAVSAINSEMKMEQKGEAEEEVGAVQSDDQEEMNALSMEMRRLQNIFDDPWKDKEEDTTAG